MPRKSKATLRIWQPETVVDEKLVKLSRAFGKFGLAVEGQSKKVLQKSAKVKSGKRWVYVRGGGRGKRTGTLQRSIHTAQPGYRWAADDVESSDQAPERGSKRTDAAVSGRRLSLLVGSGLVYAHVQHLRYKYLTLGLARAKPQLNGFIDEELGK